MYNGIEKENPEKGDTYEGAEWIENAYIKKVNVKHPTLGEFNFLPHKESPFKFIQYNHNYLTCSFYILTTRNFGESGVQKIDERMHKLGDNAIIIKQPDFFLNQLKKTLENTNYSFQYGIVNYMDLSGIRKYDMNPFIKKIEHSYQREFRIVIKNQLNRKYIRIGSIKEYAEMVSSNLLIEADWEVNRH
ncbi:hypothetical protein M3P19_05140 [Muricauda sp. 2012CJ35-5]|uniref:Uncharacterized protein n=1 Tax=Flagellimonas spongiicola TaxID=2942208 RepID=A0ABT0PPR3_9FLAO|nr:hypothetical protein [Allomuricauda spongiicola]MCL6273383.1 hypothetical protein [Allomuricauda spongiicola]